MTTTIAEEAKKSLLEGLELPIIVSTTWVTKHPVQLEKARKGDHVTSNDTFQSVLGYLGKNVKTVETLQYTARTSLFKELATDLETVKLELLSLNEKLSKEPIYVEALDYVFLMISD